MTTRGKPDLPTRSGPRVTHKQRVLDLLKDGHPHSHHELYRLGCIAHSRVADLRRDGHNIVAWREGDQYIYQLVPASAVDAAASSPTGLSSPAGSCEASADGAAASTTGDPVQLELRVAA